MEKLIALFCFDYTGIMARPWAEAGFQCYCVDIRHPKGATVKDKITFIGADMLEWEPSFDAKNVAFQAYFPPCTDLAVSGARWFKEKGLGALIHALKLFNAAIGMAASIPAPYLIENPVSTVSTYWRKPDYTFNPCDYAGYLGGENDLYTKKTCLWVGNAFKFPAPRALPSEQGSRMHLLPPSAERANLRSATPAGFARAVFEANCGTFEPVSDNRPSPRPAYCKAGREWPRCV